MIAERAARFALSHGLDHAGHRLLADARRQYAAWGAAAKVEQLDWAYATLEAEAPGPRGHEGEADPSDGRTTVTAGTIDLLGILEVRPFHRENELFQQLAPTGNSTAGTPCDSSSSEHLLPPGFVVADSHLAAGTAAFVSIS